MEDRSPPETAKEERDGQENFEAENDGQRQRSTSAASDSDEDAIIVSMEDQPSTSTGRRSRNLNSRFCPCFSPSVSDDDCEEEIERAKEASPRPGPSASEHANHTMDNPILAMARGFRTRLAIAAGSWNQQGGPFKRSNTNVHPAHEASPIPIPENRSFHPMVYTSIDFTHVLIPDLQSVLRSTYYWGVMDRYEAEKMLDNKPEGTFLLRDSAQNDYLFSVSFRRYQRTLHARIEHMDSKFSFDIHDTTIFSAATITELIENYKDPSKCLFFEPLLCTPLHRNFVFPLQSLCRAVISKYCTYESVVDLPVPQRLKSYLREYHYKQPVQLHVWDPQSGEKFTTTPPAAYIRTE